jgi:DNA-binding beta-propeller fold protein YncE
LAAGQAGAGNWAFVTKQNSSDLSAIDLDIRTVIRLIPCRANRRGLRCFSNTVSFIDTKTLERVGVIWTGDGPRAFGAFIAPEPEPGD